MKKLPTSNAATLISNNRPVRLILPNINDLLRLVPSSLGEALIVTDRKANILFMNQTAENLTGYPAAEIAGRPATTLFSLIDRKTGKAVKFPVGEKIQPDKIIKFGEDTIVITKTGRQLAVAGSISPLLNDAAASLGLVIIFYNVTAQKHLEKQLEYLSTHDALTGLYNRAYFEFKTLGLEKMPSRPVCLIVCDIDGLKIINDTMGHKKGDELLTAAAAILKNCFPAEDTVARIGGDEFAVILPAGSPQVVSDACRRIRQNVLKYNEINSGLPLSISLGFAVDDRLPVNATGLFNRADNNMYKEKLLHSKSIRSNMVGTMMRMIEARDFVTEGHCERLKNLVEIISLSLGLTEDKINELQLLAEFHDIGKIGIPDGILLKKGPLTPEERAEMQKHCEIGQHIAMSSPDLAHIANLIFRHHEWWNGHGYPLRIKGENIPLECRILAIIDAYDAMTNDRPYRKAMSPPAALAELRKCAGTQFDPLLVFEFSRTLEAVKIYAASSVRDALLRIKHAYIKTNPAKNVIFKFAGSGALKQQIEAGALADIFISAAPRPMDELQAKNLLLAGTPKNLLQNKIVLIAARKSAINCDFKSIASKKITKIAIGDPAAVPAGKYARDVLTSLGILETVKPKLIYGKDVRQVLKYVETGNIDVGIVYHTDAIVSNKVKILDYAPAYSHSPVVYPAAIMSSSSNQEESRAFLNFLTGIYAKKIFEQYGFVVLPS